MKLKQFSIVAAVILPFYSESLFAAEPAPVKRYSISGDPATQPYGVVVPNLRGGGYDLNVTGPGLARLADNGDVQWGLATDTPARGIPELRSHPTQPLVLATLRGLVDEEFWTVFGAFDGRTGTRRFERGFRAAVNKVNEFVVIPHPFSSVEFLPSGRFAFVEDDHSESIKIAVLNTEGEPVWQKRFVSPSLKETSSQGMNASLREDAQMGFWLMLKGAEGEANAVQRRIFHLLRLDAAGKPLWTMTMADFAPDSAFSATQTFFDNGGGMLLFNIEQASSPIPTPLPKLTVKLISFNADGGVRWARTFPDYSSGQGPVWNLQKTEIFLPLAKLISLTPLRIDNWLVKLDANSGTVLRSVKLGMTGATGATSFNLIGVSDQKIFLSGSQSDGSRAPGSIDAFVGHLNADLKNPVWRQLIRTDLRNSPRAVYDASRGRLSFSVSVKNAGSADLISLDGNLQTEGLVSIDPAAGPCEFFIDAALAISDAPLTGQAFNIEQSRGVIEVHDTTIDLAPSTRLQFRPLNLRGENLCRPAADGLPKPPELKIKTKAAGTGLEVHFLTQSGVKYELLHSPSLHQVWATVATVTGEGSTAQFPVDVADSRQGYYTVRAYIFPSNGSQ